MSVDLQNVLAELRKERDAIEAAIVSLQRLERGAKAALGHQPDFSTRSSAAGANGGYRIPDPDQSS